MSDWAIQLECRTSLHIFGLAQCSTISDDKLQLLLVWNVNKTTQFGLLVSWLDYHDDDDHDDDYMSSSQYGNMIRVVE